MYEVSLIKDESLIYEYEGLRLETLDIMGNGAYVGYIKYSYLKKDTIDQLKEKYKDRFKDIFCEVFEIMDEEAEAILIELEKREEALYLNKIDIGLNRGMGIGKIAMEKFIENNNDNKIVLFSYPVPTRWQLSLNKAYMRESIEKLDNFYKDLGFQQLDKTCVFVK